MAHGFAQVTLVVGLDHGVADDLLQAPALDLHVFAVIHEEHGRAGVLAQGELRAAGQIGILDELGQDFLGRRRVLFRLRLVEGDVDVVREDAAGV
jgi:hypothetical protein